MLEVDVQVPLVDWLTMPEHGCRVVHLFTPEKLKITDDREETRKRHGLVEVEVELAGLVAPSATSTTSLTPSSSETTPSSSLSSPQTSPSPSPSLSSSQTPSHEESTETEKSEKSEDQLVSLLPLYDDAFRARIDELFCPYPALKSTIEHHVSYRFDYEFPPDSIIPPPPPPPCFTRRSSSGWVVYTHPQFLPGRHPDHHHVTIVLDLDQTLITNVSIATTGSTGEARNGVSHFVVIRPYVYAFLHCLKKVLKNVEIILWSAGQRSHVTQCLEHIDPNHEFFDHAICHGDLWYPNKDLSMLGRSRNLASCLLLDDSLFSTMVSQKQSLLVPPFIYNSEKSDVALLHCMNVVVFAVRFYLFLSHVEVGADDFSEAASSLVLDRLISKHRKLREVSLSKVMRIHPLIQKTTVADGRSVYTLRYTNCTLSYEDMKRKFFRE